MVASPIIKVSHLSVDFQRWGQSHAALVDINLEVLQQQWIMVAGHNGSGKSTLLKTLTGYVEPTKGTVEFGRSDGVAELKNRFSSELFYVSQDPLAGTAEELTLLENLVVAEPHPHRMKVGFNARQQEYASLLNEFGLTTRANQLLKYFSGGERQQIALLIAKLRNPRVLLLDEPFAALDPDRVPTCLQLIASMNDAGCTVLQISHEIHLARSVGHRTIVLEHGRILHDRVGADRIGELEENGD